jgi:dienelactone hydrolase
MKKNITSYKNISRIIPYDIMKRSYLIKIILTPILSGFILMLPCFSYAQEENLNVLDRWIEWSDGNNMLIHHLNDQAFDLLDKRDQGIAGYRAQHDWISRQKKVKEIYNNIIGPFPERTPLNAKVTGVLQKDGFWVEKILFESMPGFYVTGCLFIPDGIIGKRPAILNVIGHTTISFRAELYQELILHLVQKGFIVFAIDPISQGERIQYYDTEKGKSSIGIATREHSYFGNQCYIAGVSPGKYFTWDGIRAIDYLVTRSEVDTERIGLTGISGGGNLTAYIGACDDRVKAAAPTCWITGYRRLIESIGPQDAEQNLYHVIKHGLSHADFIYARLPKPTLIVSTTRDFFSIQGTRESFAEIKKAYKTFGREDDILMTEDDDVHTLTKKNNQATVEFFQKYLDFPGDPVAGKIKFIPAEELKVTGTGQVSATLGGESVFSLNKKESMALMGKINASRQNSIHHSREVISKAKELSGYIEPAEEVKSVFRGRYQRDGYSVEMYALHGEGEYVIPLLLFVPNARNRFPSVIYMHPEGKAPDAAPGGKIEQLVKKGYIVAAPDVIGVGEVRDNNYGSFYLSLMIARSIPGIQAGDVSRVVNFLKSRPDVDKSIIKAVAFDEMGPSLLHAAAFNNLITDITVIGSLVSYRTVVMNRFYNTRLSRYFVAGSLTAYDLPDLAASLAPRKLVMANITDGEGKMIDISKGDADIEIIRTAYKQKQADNQLRIISSATDEKVFGHF